MMVHHATISVQQHERYASFCCISYTNSVSITTDRLQRSVTMPPSPFHVIIIGGGLGGLCLAQGLKKAGISVALYERDRTPNDRLQGYRIHIEPQGNLALHACLSPDLFEIYRATAGNPGNGLRIVTEQLSEISFFPNPTYAVSDPDLAELSLAVG